MITLQHQFKKDRVKEMSGLSKYEAPVSGNLKPVFKNHLSVSPKSLPKKKASKFQSPLLKRVSPFLLAVPVIAVIFFYQLVVGTGAAHSDLLLLILFPFAITNILFIDFCLWNYFAGKKKLLIWAVELIAIIMAAYLFF